MDPRSIQHMVSQICQGGFQAVGVQMDNVQKLLNDEINDIRKKVENMTGLNNNVLALQQRCKILESRLEKIEAELSNYVLAPRAPIPVVIPQPSQTGGSDGQSEEGSVSCGSEPDAAAYAGDVKPRKVRRPKKKNGQN